MKKLLCLFALSILVFSCRPQIDKQPEQLYFEDKGQNAETALQKAERILIEQKTGIGTELGTVSDTNIPVIFKTQGAVLRFGNSIVYNEVWCQQQNFPGKNVVNRGMSGTRYMDVRSPWYVENSITYYAQNKGVTLVIVHQGENEIIRCINDNAGNPTPTHRSKMFADYKYHATAWFAEVRRQNPKLKVGFEPVPKFPYAINKGFIPQIDSMNIFLAELAASDSNAFYLQGVYDFVHDNNQPKHFLYRDNETPNGVHFKSPGQGYPAQQLAVMPFMNYLPPVTNIPPPVDTVVVDTLIDFPAPVSGGPVVRIFGDYQTNGVYVDTASITVRGYLYLRLNASLSNPISGYTTAMQWRQISGPTTVTYEKPTSGNTIVYNLAKGKYYFEVAVTNSYGKTNYGRLVATFK